MKAQGKDCKPLMGQGVSLKALGEGNMTTIGFVNYSLLNINKAQGKAIDLSWGEV